METPGTFVPLPPYPCAELTAAGQSRLTDLGIVRLNKHKEYIMDKLLDAKYNRYLDSAAIRITLIATGFCMWLAAGFTLLKFGV
jgi:hypothetical protein